MTTPSDPVLISRLLDPYKGIPAPLINQFVDGAMEAYYATSDTLTTTGAYLSSALMYVASCGTGGAGTATRGTIIPGGYTPGMTRRTLGAYMKHTQSTASTGSVPAAGSIATITAPYIFQKIERVSSFDGVSANYGVWLWVDSGTITIPAIFYSQYCGTNGTASTNTVQLVNWVVTQTPQLFTVRIDFPALTSKTVSGGNDCTFVGMILPVGVTFALNHTFWDIGQCSPFIPATGLPMAFRYIDAEVELLRSMRFYQANLRARNVTYMSSNAEYTAPLNWVPMRIPPAAAITATSQQQITASTTITAYTNNSGAVISLTNSNTGQAAGDVTYNLNARL